jgi:peptide chain release factor 1
MKKELLFSITKDDFNIERTKGSGKGGQNRNKRETAIRLTHKATGIQSYCADERSQDQNLKRAFKNLINKPEFQKWFRIEKSKQLIGKQKLEEKINKWVDEQMQEKYLKIEYI